MPDGGPVAMRKVVDLIWPVPHVRIGNRCSVYQRRNSWIMMFHRMVLHGLRTKLPIYDMRAIVMPCIGVRSRIVRCIRVVVSVNYMVWLLGRGLIEMRLRCHWLFLLLPSWQRGKCGTVRPYGTHIFTGRRRAWGGAGPFTPVSPLLETEDCNCDDGNENGNSSYRASNNCAGAIK